MINDFWREDYICGKYKKNQLHLSQCVRACSVLETLKIVDIDIRKWFIVIRVRFLGKSTITMKNKYNLQKQRLYKCWIMLLFKCKFLNINDRCIIVFITFYLWTFLIFNEHNWKICKNQWKIVYVIRNVAEFLS